MPGIKKYLSKGGLEDYNELLPHSPAQVQEYVNDWLDEHPEATTTVQDGSITGVKIANDTIPDAKLVQTGGVLELVNDIYDVLPKGVEVITRVTADSGATWEIGKFYTANGIGSNILQSNYASLACAVYGNVSAGDIFNVTAQSIGSGYAIYLTDSNGIVLDIWQSPSGTAYYDDAQYTVPYDGVMYLNTAITTYLDGAKRYRLTQNVPVLTPIKSPLDGVKWVSFGDSIVEFNSTAEANWVKDMIAATGVVNTNVAFSGSGFYRQSEYQQYSANNYISKITSVPSDVELITVAGSFNDIVTSPWPNLPIGTASDTGTSTIAGYMNDFFDALLTAFPTVPIAVHMTNPWDLLKPGNASSDAYVEVLGEICKKNGIPFYPECYYGCNLKPWIAENKTEYFTRASGYVDGIHPNTAGHVFLYRMLRPFIEKCAHTII